MIESKDIKKFARDIFSQNRGRKRSITLLHPERDWFFILTIFSVSFLVGVTVALWHLQTYRNLPNTIVGETNSNLPHFSSLAVKEVHEKFRNKQDSFANKLETIDTVNATSTVDKELEEDTESVETQSLNEGNAGATGEANSVPVQSF